MPRPALAATLAIAALACSGPPERPPAPSPLAIDSVDDARLRAAADEPQSWLTYGGSYAEQRYSRLAQIDATNVKELGLAWYFDTGLPRGHEATPIVVDGVIYTTGSWSVVFAIDARTGKLRWRHDPHVPRAAGGNACCDVVNRGVAVYRGRVYAATLDGRLQALDAVTGKVVWSVMTVDATRPYTITMAPRVVKGKVIIGNGGAELGVRGYVSAYDAETGAQVWRFYTVPGDPSQPFENPELAAAAKTWDPSGEYWKVGGGGTVWNAVSYDPELDLLYVGTSNGSPWSKHIRSPGDTWDFTSTQDIVLAAPTRASSSGTTRRRPQREDRADEQVVAALGVSIGRQVFGSIPVLPDRSELRVPARRLELPARMGSDRAEGGLARAVRGPVERRHAHDRREPRVPGHRARHVRGLSRERRRFALGRACGHRDHRRARELRARRHAVRRGDGGVGWRVRAGRRRRGRRRRCAPRDQLRPAARVSAGRHGDAAGPARGLFHGAIVQSGGTRSSGLEEAEPLTTVPVEGRGQSSNDLLVRLVGQERLARMTHPEIAAFLRAQTAETIIAAYPENGKEGDHTGFYDLPQQFRDGVVLPEVEVPAAFASGDYARVPVILGTNRDEAKLFMFASSEHVARFLGVPRLRDAKRYEREARYRSRFWKAYGVDEPAAAMRRAQGPSVYAYRFDWDEQPRVFGADLGHMLGAAHVMEVPFVFGYWNLGPNSKLLFNEDNAPAREALSGAMQSYWGQFAWTGSSGRGRDGKLPAWNAWDPSQPTADKYIAFDTPAGGGIRMAHETESTGALIAELARDSAFDAPARCEMLADWIRDVPTTVARAQSLGCAARELARGN